MLRLLWTCASNEGGLLVLMTDNLQILEGILACSFAMTPVCWLLRWLPLHAVHLASDFISDFAIRAKDVAVWSAWICLPLC